MDGTKRLKLNSTAPHVWPAAGWRQAWPHKENLILYHSADFEVEVGIRQWNIGRSSYQSDTDMLCYIIRGTGRVLERRGQMIQAQPGTLMHFKQGWDGEIAAREDIHASYMRCKGGPMETTPVLQHVITATPLKDWGEISTIIEGTPRTAGILLSREKDGRAESGIWTCTPGRWRCAVASDEFCHFLAGSCTYTHDSGERIEIQPDTLAFFPQGWCGQCEVQQTIRKVYMIR
jgi:uncharacterized protein